VSDTRTDEELNRIIAGWMGWKPSEGDLKAEEAWEQVTGNRPTTQPPDYCNDMNAMHEAVLKLSDDQIELYSDHVYSNRAFRFHSKAKALHTAGMRQRAEALVTVIEGRQ
jgi:hypothetical protein